MKYNKAVIMKRAWTAYRKRLNRALKVKVTFSSSLRWSWKIAKEDQEKNEYYTINNIAFKVWSKVEGMTRLYFLDNSYLQINKYDRQPSGYYERHRYCKGERFFNINIKAFGAIASELLVNNNKEVYNKAYAVA